VVIKHLVVVVVVVVVVVRQALPIWGDKCPEEMRNSTRL